MELLAYAIYDTKAEVFDRPFYVQNDQVAIRSLADALADGRSPLAKHAPDYCLFCLGSFNDHTGYIEGFSPRNLGMIVGLARSVKPFNNRDLFDTSDQGDESTPERDDPPVLDRPDGGDSKK